MSAGISVLVLALVLVLVQLQPSSAGCVTCRCTITEHCCLEVAENSNAGTVVGRDNSTRSMNLIAMFSAPVFSFDQDASSPGAGGAFVVNSSTGEISTLRELDRERENFTTQSMTFSDSGYCIQIVISVTERNDPNIQNRYLVNVQVADINDNRPMFSQSSYTLMVPETTEDAPTVMCSNENINLLQATDMDDGANAMVVYSVEGSDLFRVRDPAIPCIVNRQGVVLDRESGPANYSFMLVASDGGQPSPMSSRVMVTYVLQDVNDVTPVFQNATYRIPIPESLRPVAVIGQLVAEDQDLSGGSSLVYSIVDSNEFFEIGRDSGNLTLIRSVDADMVTSPGECVTYMLTVEASDGEHTGSANVIVTVLDVNEPAVVSFGDDSGTIEIPENEVRNFVTIISIRDSDKTSQNRNTSIQVVDGDEFFEVATQFGFMFLRQVKAVDYEENTTIQLTLETTEHGQPLIHEPYTYNLTVGNVNDNLPTLTLTEFSFEENTTDAVIVDLSQYVFDADEGESGLVQAYELISVTNDMMEEIDFTGSLNMTTGVLYSGDFAIDRETLKKLIFTVNVTDMGQPALSQLLNFTVVITDVNDNRPVFEETSYTFHLRENLPFESPVGRVIADDLDDGDNGTVRYFIDDDDPQFMIRERTGGIISGTMFDREIRDTYHIIIIAEDGGNPPLAAYENANVTIIIDDVDDNDPMFTKNRSEVSIDTNTEPGTEVATVTATDQDEPPFDDIVYRIDPSSPSFSIADNRSGVITLTQALTIPEVFQLNISAFNPGREENGATILVTINVVPVSFPILLTVGAAGGAAGFLLFLIIIVLILICCLCYRNRKYKRKYPMTSSSVNSPNNIHQSSILKIPATNGQQPRSRGVTFKESVQETHYNEQSVVIDVDNTIRKESITKFDNSPRARHLSEEEEEVVGLSPLSEHQPRQPKELLDVVDLEMSPSNHLRNGDVPGNHSYMHPHSPIVHVMTRSRGGGGGSDGGGGGGRGPREEVDYSSQNTSSDGGHTYMDDDESMFSDDASIMNTNIPRFGDERHDDLETQYRTPPIHQPSHLELLQAMSHGQSSSHNSSLAQLQAYNREQLAKANRQQQQQHYSNSSLHNMASEHDHTSLTLTPPAHSHITPPHVGSGRLQHTSISTTQSSIHSTALSSHHPPSHYPTHLPPSAAAAAATSTTSPGSKLLPTGRNYPHPLVMPDAFPRDTTDIHRFPIGSYQDYGENSTYASTELDEALGFTFEAEPGIISLTATDYEDTEL